MTVPSWIVVFSKDGEQLTIVRCRYEKEEDDTIYHNQYYGLRCLKIKVKNFK